MRCATRVVTPLGVCPPWRSRSSWPLKVSLTDSMIWRSGLKKGLRGRFGNYIPPVLEALGLAEVEHNARNNRMRAR